MKKIFLILTVILAINTTFGQENKTVKSGEKFIYVQSSNRWAYNN